MKTQYHAQWMKAVGEGDTDTQHLIKRLWASEDQLRRIDGKLRLLGINRRQMEEAEARRQAAFKARLLDLEVKESALYDERKPWLDDIARLKETLDQ